MKKFKIFFNIEKEEQWLNQQLEKGYYCTHISRLGIYTFTKSYKKYVMRLDYQDYTSSEKFEEYKTIYNDFGWNLIKGSRFGAIQYWQKEAGNQNEIFSDCQSKCNYYKRLMTYSLTFAALCSIISYFQYKGAGSMYHEGLWAMEGTLFWKALLFETPFVLLKLGPALLVVLFASSFYKAYRKHSILKAK